MIKVKIILAALVLFYGTSIVEAQVYCGPRAGIVKNLIEKHNEAPVVIALSGTGHIMEVFSSPNGETWTILMTSANNTTCLMAEGTSLELRPVPKKKNETDQAI